MGPDPVKVSADYLGKVLGDMELRLVREIQAVKEEIPSETDVRSWARDEMGIANRAAWSVRSVLLSLGMLGASVSTFLLTLLRDGGH